MSTRSLDGPRAATEARATRSTTFRTLRRRPRGLPASGLLLLGLALAAGAGAAGSVRAETLVLPLDPGAGPSAGKELLVVTHGSRAVRAWPLPLPLLPPILRLEVLPLRRVAGRVVDGGGDAVHRARVMLVSDAAEDVYWPPRTGTAGAWTGPDGRFELTPLLSGPARFAAASRGRATLFRALEIPEEPTALDLGDVVLADETLLEGVVEDVGGSPVPGAAVRVQTRVEAGDLHAGSGSLNSLVQTVSETVRSRPVSDADGRFRVGSLRADEILSLVVEKEGFGTTQVWNVPAARREPVRVTLGRRGAIAGRVMDGDGLPVSGAGISLTDRMGTMYAGGALIRDGGFGPCAEADEDGGFVLAGVTAGSWLLEVRAPGYLRGHRGAGPIAVDLAPGERIEGLELILRKGAVLTGRVMAADGAAVAGASVHANVRDFGQVARGSTQSDDEGRFRIDTLAPGRVDLLASKEAWKTTSRTIELDPGGAPVEIVLERGAEVAGGVVISGGEPVAGFEVALRPKEPSLVRSVPPQTTGPEGEFAFRGVADGAYEIVLVRTSVARGDSLSHWVHPEALVVEGGVPVTGLEIPIPDGATIRGRLFGVAARQARRVVVNGRSANPGPTGWLRGRILEGGRYEIPGAPPGEWLIRAHHRKRFVTRRVRVGPDDRNVFLDLDLERGVSITGTLLVHGEPSVGAAVNARSGALDGSFTGPGGRFELDGLEPGPVAFSIRVPDQSRAIERTIEIRGGEHLRIDLELGDLRGTVLDADDRTPLPGTRILLFPLDAESGRRGPFPALAFTTLHGELLFRGAAAGRHELQIDRAGYESRVIPLDLPGTDLDLPPVFLEPKPP